MTRKSIFQGTILVALLALTPLPLFATATAVVDDKGNDKGRYAASVEGTVSNVSGSIIKILNGQVTIDATSAIISGEEKGAALTLAAITIGSVIEVSGNPGVGTIIAARIKVHGPKSDGGLSGIITSANNNTITVLGSTISLNAATVYKRYRGMTISSANLLVGTVVSVEVVLFQGNLVATKVSIGYDD